MRLAASLAVLSAVLMLAVPISMPRASADRYRVFDTTTEFDAGTTEDPDGVVAAETSTDNRYVPANVLMAPSVFGDEFRLPDADADTWRWGHSNWAGCTDAGTQTISYTDTFGVNANDGSLIFDHDAAETSTRGTRYSTTGSGSFIASALVRFSGNLGSGGNFTFALARNSTSDTAALWCGGYTVSPRVEGAGIFVWEPTPGFKKVQSFVLSDTGALRRCEDAFSIGDSAILEIRRTGSLFKFYADRSFIGICGGGFSGPLHTVFDYVTTGATRGVSMVDWFVSYPSADANPGVGFRSTVANQNWTSPVTDTPQNAWLTRITITAYLDPGGPRNVLNQSGAFLCNIIVWRSNAWNEFYQGPGSSWAGCWPIPVETRVLVLTLNIPIGFLFAGPYRVSLSLGGHSHVATWVSSVALTLTGSDAQPPVVPGTVTGPGSTPWLAPVSGLGIFCAIIAAVAITFLVLVKKVRDRTGGV